MATLTTVYGVNNTKTNVTLPTVKVPACEAGGRVRHLYDAYTVGAGDDFGTSGLVKLMTIPKGARVVGMQLVCPDLGTTGQFEVGWAASAESGAEIADPNGFFTTVTATSAVDSNMSGALPGWNKTFSEAVEVQIDFTQATDVAAGLTIKISLLYVLD